MLSPATDVPCLAGQINPVPGGIPSMFSNLRTLFRKHNTRKARKLPRRTFRGEIEQLEKRELLTAYTPGNLVVLQLGDGTQYGTSPRQSSTSPEAPFYLNEYTATPGAAIVQQSMAVSTGTVGGTGNQPITQDLTAAAGNGQLTRTADGAGLVFGGVDSTVDNGGYVLPQTPTGSAQRAIAVTGNDPAAAGFINTTTYGPFYVGDDNRGGVAYGLQGPVYSYGHPNQAGGAVSQGVLYFPGPNGDGSLQPPGTAGIGPQSGVQVSSQTNIRGGSIGFDGRVYWTTAGATSLGLAGIYTSTVAAQPTGNSPGLDQPIVKALFGASKVGGMYLADTNGDGIVDNGDRIYLMDDGTVGGVGTGGLYMSIFDSARWGGSNAVPGQAPGWSPMVRIAEGIVDQVSSANGGVAQLRGLAGTVLADGTVQLFGTEFDNVAGNNSYVFGWHDTTVGALRVSSATITGTTATVNLTDPLPSSLFNTTTWLAVNSVGSGGGNFATNGGFNGVWNVTVNANGTSFTYTDNNSGVTNVTGSGVVGQWLNTGAVGNATNDPYPQPAASQTIQTFADGTLTASASKAVEALRGVSFAPVAATTLSNFQVNGAASVTVPPGTNVTFTVHVANPQAGVTLTGLKVTFIDLNTNSIIGQGTIDGSGNASFATSTLVGIHTVAAYFAGGGPQALASARAGSTVQVNEAGTTASATSLAVTIGGAATTQAAIGRQVTLTATVTGSGATGTVSFFNGTTLLGSAAVSSGTAALTTSFAVTGTASITATYNGDATFASSTSAASSLTIGNNATAAITTSANNVSVGATPTYTVTLTGTLGPVAGTAQFFLDGTALGTVQTLNGSGAASVTSTALTAGSHLVTISYTPASTSPYNNVAVTTSTSASGTALIETARQPLTPGNLLAVQRGDGTVNLGSSGYLVFLDEYTPAGVLVQRIALPNADAGTTHALLLSGQNGAEGLINKSANGQFLTIVGYDVPVGRQFVTSTFPYQFGRTIARIDANGNVDTSTVVNTTSPTAVPYNPSDAVTNDGNEFWLSSNLPQGDTTDDGILYTTLGSTGAATQLGAANIPAAAIGIFGTGANAQLVTSGSSQDLNTVGTGLPTTAGQTLGQFPNLEAEYTSVFPTGRNPEQFAFLNTNDGSSNNPNLVYIADQANGLLKFWKDGSGNWHLGQLGTHSFGQKLIFSGGATGVVAAIINPGTVNAKVNIYVTGSNVQQANPNQIAFFQDQNGGPAGGSHGVDQGFNAGSFTTTAFVGGAQGQAPPSSPNGNMNFAGLAIVPGFSQGNLVVTQVGTGTGALTSSATATSLDQFTPAGLAQGSVALPTTVSTKTISAATWASGTVTITTSSAHGFVAGQSVVITGMTPGGYNGTFTIATIVDTTHFTYALTTNPGTATAFGTATVSVNSLTEGGTFTNEGYLTTSADGHTLSITGYNQAVGGSTSSSENRVIGEVNAAGVVDTTTQLPSQTGSVRVAISPDGQGFYVATSNGVRYIPFGSSGSTASTQITAEVPSPTVVGINNGQLWASAGAGAQANGVPALDSNFRVSGSNPLPTNGGQAIVNPPTSFPTARDTFGNFPSTNQFWVSPDGKTILFADSRTDSAGGLLEYFDTLGTGSFTLLGSLQLNSGALTSTTEAGTTVTATTSQPLSALGLVTGNFVTISGVSVGGYNQFSVQITVTGTNTFTYTLASPGLAAGSGGFVTSTDGGLRALVFDPSTNTVYATTTATSGNRLVKITGITTDGTTPTFAFTVLSTAPTNTAYRGVAFSPTNPGTTTSTTTLAVTNNPASYGTGATLTATVTSGATGWVSFRDATTGQEYGAAPIVGTTATLVTAGNLFANASAYSIVAVYTGDGTFAPSTAAAQSVTINKASTTTTVTVAPNPVANNVADTLTATVAVPAGTLPTGTVTFFDGGVQIGTTTPTLVQTISSDVISFTATLSNTFTTIGSHSITATYSGDGNFLTSTSAAVSLQVVNATTTAVTTSAVNPTASPSVNVTLTATITSADTTDTIGGTVQFFDNLLPLGSVQNVSGTSGVTATVIVPTALLESANHLTPGLHSISAIYTPTGSSVNLFFTSTGVYEQAVQAAPFGLNDEFVYRTGDGTTPLIAQTGPFAGNGPVGSTVYIDEYTTAGTAVQSIILPSADGTGGADGVTPVHAVVGNGQQSSTGQLTLSGDGQYLFAEGYDNNPFNVATAKGLPNQNDNTVPRSVARVKYDGTVQTEAFTAGSSGVETGGNINGVFSPDGNQFYLSGFNGVYYFASFAPSAALVAATAQIQNPGFTVTGLEGQSGNLVAVAGSNLISQYVGKPTSAATLSPLTGVSTTTDPNQTFTIDAYFTHLNGTGAPAGINTMYLSDNGPSFANGHITKWALNSSGTWNLVDTVTAGTGNTSVSFYWLAGKTDASGNVTLYVTYGQGGNSPATSSVFGALYSVTDQNGYNGLIGTGGTHSDAVATLSSVLGSTSLQEWRGVAFAPVQLIQAAAANGSATAVNIASISEAGTTVTVVTSTPDEFLNNWVVKIAGTGTGNYDGLTGAITVVNATTFTYTAAATGLPTLTNTGTVVNPLAGNQRSMVNSLVFTFGQAVNIAAPVSATIMQVAEPTGTTATVTTTAAHGFVVGQTVIISGVTTTGFDGNFVITSVPSATTFTITTTGSGLGTDTSGGTALVTAFIITVHPGVSITGGTGSPPTNVVPTVSYTSPDGGKTWIVTFSGSGVTGGSIADGVYDLGINNNTVTVQSTGAVLFDPPTLDTFYRMLGDFLGYAANGNEGTVSTTDLSLFKNVFSSHGSPGDPLYKAYMDFTSAVTGTGTINNVDLSLLKQRLGKIFSGFTPTM
jgi:hypothetical protein